MNLSRAVLLILVCFILFPEDSAALQVNDSLRMDGFILQGFLVTDHHQYEGTSPDGSFNFNTFDLVLKAEVNDRFRIWSKLYTSNENSDIVTLEWAFGEYYFNDMAMLRVGKIRMPVGIYNEIRHVYPVLPIIFEPIFYDEGNQFVPVHFKGVSLTGGNGEGASHFSYDLFVGRTGGDFEAPPNSDVDNLFGGRLWLNPLPANLKIGFSYYHGVTQTAPVKQSQNLYMGSLEYYPLPSTTFRAEFARQQIESGITKEGYYAELFTLIGDKFMPVIRYDAYYPQAGRDSAITDYQKEIVIGLTWRFSDFLSWKIENHFNSGVAEVDPSINPALYKDWNLFATSVTFVF